MKKEMKEPEMLKKEIRASIEKLGGQIPPQVSSLVEEAIVKMNQENLLPKDALGFPPEVMEMIYQQGYNLFQNGKYQDALRIFDILRQLDISDTRYSFAIASCYHYQKQYLNAVASYMIYKYLDPLDPIASFHIYDCMMKANYPLSALMAIQEALVLAGRDPQYEGLKRKMLLELDHLKEILPPYLKEKELMS
jgi:type III secretion system low calcium response chaperone LcrH/SycD